MRKEGVALQKHRLKQQSGSEGTLLVMDTQDGHLRRTVKIAKFTIENYAEYMLYEPHIVWVNEGRFVLQGYERVLRDGQVAEYAQSWLCKTDY